MEPWLLLIKRRNRARRSCLMSSTWLEEAEKEDKTGRGKQHWNRVIFSRRSKRELINNDLIILAPIITFVLSLYIDYKCTSYRRFVAGMETLLEQQRRYHEERERLLDALVQERMVEKKSNKDAINSEHRQKAMLDRY